VSSSTCGDGGSSCGERRTPSPRADDRRGGKLVQPARRNRPQASCCRRRPRAAAPGPGAADPAPRQCRHRPRALDRDHQGRDQPVLPLYPRSSPRSSNRPRRLSGGASETGWPASPCSSTSWGPRWRPPRSRTAPSWRRARPRPRTPDLFCDPCRSPRQGWLRWMPRPTRPKAWSWSTTRGCGPRSTSAMPVRSASSPRRPTRSAPAPNRRTDMTSPGGA
jgi:hypothetical protein